MHGYRAMKKEVFIRPAKPDEGVLLSQLAFASKANGYTEAFMEACRSELTWSESDLRDEAYRFLVAESDGKLRGFTALLLDQEGSAELEALFVDPASAGKGIGSTLLTGVVKVACALGIRAVTIQSDPGAVPFYERFGAQKVGESPSGSIEGRMLPVLVLDLSQPLFLPIS